MESKFPTIFLIEKEKKDFLTSGREKRVPRSTASTTLYVKLFQSGRTFFCSILSFTMRFKNGFRKMKGGVKKLMLISFQRDALVFQKVEHQFPKR